MKQDNNKEILLCNCHSTDHQLVILYSEDELDNGSKYPMVYAHIHLNKLPFWERLKYGLKYIFGHKCRYGAFDEFIFNPEDATKLKEVVKYLKKEKTKKTKKLKKNG